MKRLPSHLRKYIVEQDYSKYTAIDHSVWRYILRQLRNFLATHAHEYYLDGLEKTGIEIESIPRIEDISRKLEKFGWRALPVSGFIPPAAFMELQSQSVLPIASDMRTLEHLSYTPAPDIVHEAAGHAPMLIHPEFSAYLRKYAQVARKAIISREDLNLYSAIRDLSDIKENPNSTPEEIDKAEKHLAQVSKSISHVSEASLLGRMNWWTAEYGLIGSLQNPKIFGAGLLSSVGESRWCLSKEVKKIPLTVKCIDQSYDITEPQPQLFVTPDFKTLEKVLEELAEQMAFKTGGMKGLQKAIQAESVNTVQMDSGLQISGQLIQVISTDESPVSYLKFKGPTQLSFEDRELSGHDKNYHRDGYGTVVGFLKDFPTVPPSDLTDSQWEKLGLQLGQEIHLRFSNGINVQGVYLGRVVQKKKTLVLSFKNATVKLGSQILFDPSWGTYDLGLGSSVPSVFGGPADDESYGDNEDFAVKRVPAPTFTTEQKHLQSLYSEVRYLRENEVEGEALQSGLMKIFSQAQKLPDWLLPLEIYELCLNRGVSENFSKEVLQHLENLKKKNSKNKNLIDEGLELAHQL